jgi:hypothetical protein
MKFTAAGDDGTPIDFECGDTTTSRCDAILQGKTYPYLPFVSDVRVVFDAGAGCGAASVHFARHYPDAEIHAFEPGSEAQSFLQRNVSRYANVRVHQMGLHAIDQWTAEHSIERTDVLKLAVARSDVSVLESLTALLPTVKVLYVEYGSRQIRRDIARLVDATHELYTGVMFLDQGQCVYLGRDLVDLGAAVDHLKQSFMSARIASQPA